MYMMHTNEFEEAFSNFLERHEYDEAENYLFSMVRLAFVAGWKAAGGDPPKAERLFELIVTPKAEGPGGGEGLRPGFCFSYAGAQSCSITAWNRR